MLFGQLSASANKKAVEVHNYLANANPELANDEEALCRMLGFTKRGYLHALGYEAMQPAKKKTEKASAKANRHEEDEHADNDCVDDANDESGDVYDKMEEGEDNNWIGDVLTGREEER